MHNLEIKLSQEKPNNFEILNYGIQYKLLDLITGHQFHRNNTKILLSLKQII